MEVDILRVKKKNAITACDILAYPLMSVFHTSNGREYYLHNNCIFFLSLI